MSTAAPAGVPPESAGTAPTVSSVDALAERLGAGVSAASTPHYVLIDGDLRIGPQVVPLNAGIEWTAIYGFSDKGPYDKFCTNGQLALKPYPLVKGYLRNQIDSRGDSLKLVVIDAAGPSEPYLRAATMKAVLAAQESRAVHVIAAYRLTFDEGANAYRVDEQCDAEQILRPVLASKLDAIHTTTEKPQSDHPAHEVTLTAQTCVRQPITYYK